MLKELHLLDELFSNILSTHDQPISIFFVVPELASLKNIAFSVSSQYCSPYSLFISFKIIVSGKSYTLVLIL